MMCFIDFLEEVKAVLEGVFKYDNHSDEFIVDVTDHWANCTVEPKSVNRVLSGEITAMEAVHQELDEMIFWNAECVVSPGNVCEEG
jgi:hypothetical protein